MNIYDYLSITAVINKTRLARLPEKGVQKNLLECKLLGKKRKESWLYAVEEDFGRLDVDN